MRTWLGNKAEDLWILLRRNGQWWWGRRLRISDWCFAVLTLPFNGIMMVAGASNRVSLLSTFSPSTSRGFPSALRPSGASPTNRPAGTASRRSFPFPGPAHLPDVADEAGVQPPPRTRIPPKPADPA